MSTALPQNLTSIFTCQSQFLSLKALPEATYQE